VSSVHFLLHLTLNKRILSWRF